MNIKLTQQLKFLEEFEKECPDAEILKLTPSRITFKLPGGSVVYVGFK